MTEPTRAVARPPIGSENNQPTWTRHSLESEVLRSLYTRRTNSWWNRPNPLLGVGLLVSALLVSALHYAIDGNFEWGRAVFVLACCLAFNLWYFGTFKRSPP